LGKRPDYLWFTVFDEHGDHARLAVLAALFDAIDRAPYRSNFAPVRLAKTPKRFGKPLSTPLKHEILPPPNDDSFHAFPFARQASEQAIRTLKTFLVEKFNRQLKRFALASLLFRGCAFTETELSK
jgi:hypothetical protein